MRTIYLDMDGTIADLYGADDWLERIYREDATLYADARPLCDMGELCELLGQAQAKGYKVGIITWLAKDATKEYKQAITRAKRGWIANYLSIKLDEEHYIQYGTRKDYVAKDKEGILFDDDLRVREKWRGKVYNPQEDNIIEIMKKILS